ncbi:MAG: M1 family metallopeptidase [Proteobacteria bacterium]|nr:M1 family metallopeptidase [Pseudomonadota bacterium]
MRRVLDCFLVFAAGTALGAACSSSPGTPAVKPLPEPDPYPALITRGPLSPRIANYDIRVRFDPVAHRIVAEQTLRWTNPATRPVSKLPFHLYMNAFKNEESVFMRESRGRHRDARASETGWGWIDVTAVQVHHNDVTISPDDVTISPGPNDPGEPGPMRAVPGSKAELLDRVVFPGPDETVLEVPLDQPVQPGQTIEVFMAFEVQLPEVFARTGYKNAFHMVGQWFPKIGVVVGEPGSERWHCEPFHLHSEFFADFGVYDVAIQVPNTHTVAATGVLTGAVDNGDGTRTLTYHAEDVHDFAWMADPHIDVIEGEAKNQYGTVRVRVYHRPAQRHFAERHLHAGIGAIEQFSALYVPYPWSLISIIDPPPRAARGAGGMEYPTFVTTAGDSFFTPPGVRLPEYITVHEVGHNWFQGMLASNEVDEAWLDEGVNEYADSIVMDALYGDGSGMVDWAGFRASSHLMRRAASGFLELIPAPIETISYEFPDYSSYAMATYLKTGLALRTLENIVGVEDFRRAMAFYAQRFAFRHPTGRDFFSSLEQALGRQLDWFVEPAFRQIGAVHYEVRDINCRRKHKKPRGVFGRGDDKVIVTPEDGPETDTWTCQVLIVNVGRVPAPVDVRIEFDDGTIHREHLSVSFDKTWHRISVERKSPVARVVIDPDQAIVLDSHLHRRDVRTDPALGPARRAAARAQFWTQTLLQVVGL